MGVSVGAASIQPQPHVIPAPDGGNRVAKHARSSTQSNPSVIHDVASRRLVGRKPDFGVRIVDAGLPLQKTTDGFGGWLAE